MGVLKKLTIVIFLSTSLICSGCTMTSIHTPDDTSIRYGQFFQHKQLTYNTDTTGKVTFTYSTQPKGQDELIKAVISAYQAGQIAGGM